jgi:glycosyltransferase involved in cell wall biosynthesis
MTHYAFPPTTGGVESHLWDLCTELVKQGHRVHALVGSLQGRPEEEEIEGVLVHRRDLMNPEWIREEKRKRGVMADEEDRELIDAVRRMYQQFVADQSIDVIHGHNFHHFVPEHALALTEIWEQGVPNLLTVHEVWSEFICEDLLRRAKWDFIITFCEHVKSGILEQAPHLDNLHLIYPGIDVEQFSPNTRDKKWARRLRIENRPTIIHPARMLPWKGVIYSIQAMRHVVQKYPDAVLIITDTDDIVDWIRELAGYKEEALGLIEELGLSRNVVTKTFPYADLPSVYNHCQVVLYPTIGEEPFGLVPVEAMACAKPLVVTRSGGMVESVVEGETGFFVRKRDSRMLAESILALLDDEDLARKMGEKGRARAVEVFSRARMVRETVQLYEQAMQLHAGHRALAAGPSRT